MPFMILRQWRDGLPPWNLTTHDILNFSSTSCSCSDLYRYRGIRCFRTRVFVYDNLEVIWAKFGEAIELSPYYGGCDGNLDDILFQ